MKHFFFPKMAWTGIRKNRKLYLPYLLSCIGMIMMFCILHNLSYSPVIRGINAGNNIQLVLGLGQFVIAFFALLFLFYTNSFLIRRRYKEFGLYNILGMDKRGIARVLFWESLIVAGIGLAGGLFLGVALSKLAELGLLNVIHAEVDYRFTFSWETVAWTAGVFGIIFALLFVRSLVQVHKAKPLELLRSENTGEKAPRANWVPAVLGVLILGAAYTIAVSIESPVTALVVFFVAVLMVILATYLLFIAGSVALCKLLQKNKGFYYQKKNFVSLSSMVYRMKRNGAGLASICILCTMVLVIIASTSSLYFGANESIRARYPFEIQMKVTLSGLEDFENGRTEELREGYRAVLAEHGAEPVREQEYRIASIAAMQQGSDFDPNAEEYDSVINYDVVRSIWFVSAEDYNAAMGTDIALGENECMILPQRCRYDESSFNMGELHLAVVGKLEKYIPVSETSAMITPTLMLVVPDYETLRPLLTFTFGEKHTRSLELAHYYGFDLGLDEETTNAAFGDLRNYLAGQDCWGRDDGADWFIDGREMNRSDFYTTYGGLFFLGIILSIVFVFAAAMILYYKQVSEGYEDQARYAIMRKVGMTKKDIRQSINTQVLTVFFAPLLMAGVHLAFAFPLIWKLLQLFSLFNLRFVILVTAIAFVAFGAVYAVIYKLTARAYYSIVSTGE